MSRYRAFGIHLLISLALFVAIFVLMHFYGYPTPFFAADGGWAGLRILISVALVAGPLLTLIVFRAHKKRLRMDLTLIGLFQLITIGFGLHILYHQRLQMVVYAHGSFYGLDSTRLNQAGPKARVLLRTMKARPAYVFVNLPTNKEAVLAIAARILRGEPPLYLRSWRYGPYNAQARARVLQTGLPMTAIIKVDPKAAKAWQRFKQDHPDVSQYVFVPFHGTYHSIVLALKRPSAQIVGTLDFNPTKFTGF